jgi:hypothetical protein
VWAKKNKKRLRVVFTKRLKERLSVFTKVEQQKCCYLKQLHLCLK